MHRVKAKRIPARKIAATTDQYKVFHGVGCVIAEVKSDTVFSVIAVLKEEDRVDFTSLENRFTVDLMRTPKNCGSANWDSVVVDDRGIDEDGNELDPDPDTLDLPIGVTSIGAGSPGERFHGEPFHGAFVGAVYLEHKRYTSLHDKLFPDWPPPRYKRSQLTTIAYSPDEESERRNKRYHGFLATVIEVSQTSPPQVELLFDDQVDHQGKPIKIVITPQDTNNYDPDPPGKSFEGEVSLAADLREGARGVLFVELQTAVRLELRDIKIPVGLGG